MGTPLRTDKHEAASHLGLYLTIPQKNLKRMVSKNFLRNPFLKLIPPLPLIKLILVPKKITNYGCTLPLEMEVQKFSLQAEKLNRFFYLMIWGVPLSPLYDFLFHQKKMCRFGGYPPPPLRMDSLKRFLKPSLTCAGFLFFSPCSLCWQPGAPAPWQVNPG